MEIYFAKESNVQIQLVVIDICNKLVTEVAKNVGKYPNSKCKENYRKIYSVAHGKPENKGIFSNILNNTNVYLYGSFTTKAGIECFGPTFLS